MKKRPRKADDELAVLRSLSPSAGAWLLNRSTRWLRDEIEAPRDDAGRFDGQTLVAWFLAREAPKRKLNGHKPTDDELLFAESSGSPALERWRESRAALSELDLAERRAGLVSASQIRGFLDGMAAEHRRLGEDLARAFGNEAVELLDQAITRMARLADDEAWLREGDV